MADGPYTGRVKSYNPEKGWGFFECDETQLKYGKDILIPRTPHMPTQHLLRKGAKFTFFVDEGHTGPIAVNLKAHPVIGKRPVSENSAQERPAKRARPAGGKRYSGAIKSFNDAKRWGFVTSEEILAEFGKDIMVVAEDLPFGHVAPGQRVSFSIGEGRTGPIAKNVQLVNSGGFMPVSAVLGVIKSFNAQKGWGFIASPQIQAMLGKDLLVHREELPNGHAEVGQEVSFAVGEGRTGPIAVNVQFIFRALPVASQRISFPRGTRGRYHGHIKSFNKEKGWGFVESPQVLAQFGKDMMILKDDLPDDAEIGQAVSFSIGEGRTGPIATKVQPSGKAKVQPSGKAKVQPSGKDSTRHQHLIGEELSGTIKSFNEKKGWGFVTSEEIQSLFGKDIMITKDALPDSVEPGELPGVQISFSVGEGRTGPIAVDVQVI